MATKRSTLRKNQTGESDVNKIMESLSQKKPITGQANSSSLSALMMLTSQLVSHGRFNKDLPSFITRGLDCEQIWQQLALRNEHKFSFHTCSREILRIQSRQSRKKKKPLKAQDKLVDESPEKSESDQEDSDASSEDDRRLNAIKKRLEDKANSKRQKSFEGFGDSEGEDDLDFDFELDKELAQDLSDDGNDNVSPDNKKRLQPQPRAKRKTIVDDKFFKLADMEQFLEQEDRKEMIKMRREKRSGEEEDGSDDEDSDDDDEEIDMFAELESDDKDAKAKYADFFDPIDDDGESKTKRGEKSGAKDDSLIADGDESGASDGEDAMEEESEDNSDLQSKLTDDDEDEEEDRDVDEDDDEEGERRESQEEERNEKKVSFSQDLLQSDDDGENDQDEMLKRKEKKSTFEERQEQLQKKAQEMEELSLKETPWELTGEASASKRPENSLLETVLDFQHTSRAAPVITDETTKTLEDYIKQRIKDKAFDDVEKKVKPKEDPFEFKKRIVLDQEKSKLSLGELYEQEFLKQQKQDDEDVKEDPECEAIEKELNQLFHRLDALSNFKYTPMKPGTEVKIVVNTPAIAMEEVAPVATADAELLAPQEVHGKLKGDLKADDERDSTDKKRARRQKKKDKREKKKAKEAREKMVEKLKPGLGNKYSKSKALKQLEQISKTDKNVSFIKGENKKMGSSTAFFSELQDEVQTNAKAKKAVKEKKKKKVTDASKLML